MALSTLDQHGRVRERVRRRAGVHAAGRGEAVITGVARATRPPARPDGNDRKCLSGGRRESSAPP